MIQMIQDIRQRTLSQIPERPAPNVEVTCETCHRGLARPMPLGQVIVEAFAAGGADSARRAYLTRGDTAAAVEAYRTALGRDSTNLAARARLRSLGQP
jgi:hypothetical protein